MLLLYDVSGIFLLGQEFKKHFGYSYSNPLIFRSGYQVRL
jgi:hypothetical protein